MTNAAMKPATQDIVVDEVFPHAPDAIWKALTTSDLIARWLMVPHGFAPVKGNKFTFNTPADDEWDGIVHCELLEVTANERLVYSWKTGQQTSAGYVPRLDTIVTWTLSRVDTGTRIRIVHSGFDPSKHTKVFRNISEGWPKVMGKMRTMLAESKQ